MADRFILVATDPQFGFAWFGEHPLGEANGPELALLPLEKGIGREALIHIHHGPGWALFDPAGIRIGEGSGLPTPDKVQELMEGAGWKSLQEGLKAHLRLHPEDGQAWLELAHNFTRCAMHAKSAGTLSHAMLARLRDELQPCLQKLVEIPGSGSTWQEPRPQPFSIMLLFLRFTGLDLDPELRDSARQLRAALPKLIAQDPEILAPWQALDWVGNPEEEDLGRAFQRNLIASLDGIPGRPWPPFFLSDNVLFSNFDHLDEAFQIAATAIATSQAPRVVIKLGRAHVIEALATWGTTQLNCLLYGRSMDEISALLGSLRMQAGKGWPQVSVRLAKRLDMRLQFEEERKIPAEKRWFTPQRLAAIRRALQEPPLADPPAPERTTLRLALLEGASDRLAWGKLQIHPAFVPWGPTELSWQPLRKVEATRLEERHGWISGQRWLVLKNDQVLASGPGLPSASALETALRGQGTPELEELDAFIQAHPERQDARRARLELLRPRLPNPLLEDRFLEDLEAVGAPPGPLPFKPDPARWTPVARRVCLRISEQIRRWPFSSSIWASYAGWSALDPRIQRPAALLSALETWPRQRALRLPGPLPCATSKAVIGVLRSQGRYSDLDAWMQTLWENGLKTWMAQWVALPLLEENAMGSALDRTALEVTPLLAAWGEALAKQGQNARLTSLRAELENLRPGLASMLSKPVN